MPVRSQHPYEAANFRVEIAGIEPVHAATVELPAASVAVIERRAGSDRASTHRLDAGAVSYTPLIVTRTMAGDASFAEWWQMVRDGQDAAAKRTVSVTLLDDDRDAVWSWNMFEAFPVGYRFGTLDAGGNEIAVETLEIAVERVEYS